VDREVRFTGVVLDQVLEGPAELLSEGASRKAQAHECIAYPDRAVDDACGLSCALVVPGELLD
jgi:hypothetical protein